MFNLIIILLVILWAIISQLELPTLGGYTPFCQAGVRAQLSIGSLVIWINKYRNGTNRNDVFHGACPVVCGHKMSKK